MTGMRSERAARIRAEGMDWYLRNREAPADEAARRAFLAWLHRSPDHVRAYLALSVVAQDIATLSVGMPTARARHRGPARVQGALRGLLASAACLCLAWAGWIHWPRTWDIATGEGEQRELRLPDGSRVHVDAGSQLQVRLRAGTREVSLVHGQAAFVVGADWRPFRVHTPHLVLEDIGTTFEVLIQPRDTRVSVAEGRVKVWEREGERGGGTLLADLGAGQGASVAHADRRVRARRVDGDALLDWRKGWLAFEDERLENLVARFDRFHPGRILVLDRAAAEVRVSGRLRQDDLDDLLEFLAANERLRVHREGDGVSIRAR